MHTNKSNPRFQHHSPAKKKEKKKKQKKAISPPLKARKEIDEENRPDLSMSIHIDINIQAGGGAPSNKNSRISGLDSHAAGDSGVKMSRSTEKEGKERKKERMLLSQIQGSPFLV